ncbi:MAG TPA: virulence factor SrfC family protein, partial [Geobacterales bacterium]|nr:virulence factor SrfC family protein [Geobacterales bacterium]
RNPNYKAEGIIEYEGRKEVRIHADKQERIAKLRAAYAHIREVNDHFRDPLKAFDEVMKLNDGGISYLAANLADVCRPGMKLDQIRVRLKDSRRALAGLLAPKYVPTDLDKRLAERELIADKILEEFGACLQKNAFGTFLRGLCVERGALADALHEPSQAIQTAVRAKEPGNLISIVKSNGNSSGKIAAAPSPSRVDRLARTSIQVWTQNLHDVSNDEVFSSRIGVSASSLRELANELVATSRRLEVEAEIRHTLDKIAHLERPHEIWAKATIVAERVLNRFVTTLGSAGPEHPVLFDAAGMDQLQMSFQEEFAVSWLRSFYAHLKENAQTADGLVHDAEQNLILGKLLNALNTEN